jgi:hypothetical protein
MLEVDGAILWPAAHVEVIAVCRLRDAELLALFYCQRRLGRR